MLDFRRPLDSRRSNVSSPPARRATTPHHAPSPPAPSSPRNTEVHRRHSGRRLSIQPHANLSDRCRTAICSKSAYRTSYGARKEGREGGEERGACAWGAEGRLWWRRWGWCWTGRQGGTDDGGFGLCGWGVWGYCQEGGVLSVKGGLSSKERISRYCIDESATNSRIYWRFERLKVYESWTVLMPRRWKGVQIPCHNSTL